MVKKTVKISWDIEARNNFYKYILFIKEHSSQNGDSIKKRLLHRLLNYQLHRRNIRLINTEQIIVAVIVHLSFFTAGFHIMYRSTKFELCVSGIQAESL